MADVIETMRQARSLKTFVKAIEKAGLADRLKGPGPFTVFAPADEAFAKLPPATVDALLANPSPLAVILGHHLVEGKITVADAAKVESIKTVSSQYVQIRHNGDVTVDNAKIVQADVACDNGILHIIDTVIMPG